VLSPEGAIGPEAFGQAVGRPDGQTFSGSVVPERPNVGLPARPTVRLKDAVSAAERDAIQRALRATDGNRREAAKLLGVSVRTLFHKLKNLGA